MQQLCSVELNHKKVLRCLPPILLLFDESLKSKTFAKVQFFLCSLKKK